MTVKQSVVEIASQLPDDCTWDDAMYQMSVRSKIEQGLEDADNGRVVDHEEVFEEFGNVKRIVWSHTARDDLRAIHAYIRRDSKAYADGVIQQIKRATERVRQLPKSGAMVPEWQDPKFREVLSGNYRIVYRPESKRVVILTVIHGARQMPATPPE